MEFILEEEIAPKSISLYIYFYHFPIKANFFIEKMDQQ